MISLASVGLAPLADTRRVPRRVDPGSACLVVPTHPPHYRLVHRLVSAVRRFAADADRVRLVAVTSGPSDPSSGLIETLGGHPLEVFSIAELIRRDLLGLSGTAAANEVIDAERRAAASRRADQLVAQLEGMRESTLRAPDLHGNLVPLHFNDGFFLSALKKLLATAHLGCGRVWVVDSEAVPFRNFSFETTLRDFWRKPTVYYVPAPKDSYYPPREGFLLNASAALLGMPRPAGWGDPVSASAGHVYRVADMWHWDAGHMRAFMRHAADNAGASSFSEAFVVRPTHELAYYTFLELVQRPRTHAFRSAKRVTDRFFSEQGLAGGTPWPSGYQGCASAGVELGQWQRYLHNKPNTTCRLLSRFGFHGMRFQKGRGPWCHTGGRGLEWARLLACRCGRDGRLLHARGAAPWQPLFEWWLSEKIVPTEDAEATEAAWAAKANSTRAGARVGAAARLPLRARRAATARARRSAVAAAV